jgi:hypothetical protein
MGSDRTAVRPRPSFVLCTSATVVVRSSPSSPGEEQFLADFANAKQTGKRKEAAAQPAAETDSALVAGQHYTFSFAVRKRLHPRPRSAWAEGLTASLFPSSVPLPTTTCRWTTL